MANGELPVPQVRAQQLYLTVHEDGDDFTLLRVLPGREGMTLAELEWRTTPDEHRPSLLGARVRAVVEALRRSGQPTFTFDPGDPAPMYLSEEWVLGARDALNDALWFIERDYRIRAQRRRNQGTIRFVMEKVKGGEKKELRLRVVPPPTQEPWICHDCGASVDTLRDLCTTSGCSSHERYFRCTGRRQLTLVPKAAPRAA